MNWTAALNGQDQSLEAMMARQHLQNQGMLSIANALEERRQNAEQERLRQQALDESHQDRADAIEERRQAQKSLDAQREAAAKKDLRDAERNRIDEIKAKAAADAEAAKTKAQMGLNNALLILATKDRYQTEHEQNKLHQDNPRLPAGVQAYLQTLPGKTKTGKSATGGDVAMTDANGAPLPYDLAAARQDISQNWGKLAQAHPNLDLKSVDEALKELFTQPNPDRLVSGPSQETVAAVRTPKGDVVQVPVSKLQDAIAAGGQVVNTGQ